MRAEPTPTYQLKRILIMIPWFGPWPAWMRCFIESCRWNPSVNWLLLGDAPPPDDVPPNMRFLTVEFDQYRHLVSSRLQIDAQWSDAYKVCDVRPAMGLVHEAEVAGYDYWGYGDLDVIYGDIRRFYTPQVLIHDLISTHKHLVSGHFTIMRNTPRMVNAFKRVPQWKTFLSTPQHKSFDEQLFSHLFVPLIRGRRAWRRLITPYVGGALLTEQYSTGLPPLKWIDGSVDFPRQWFWNRGHLTTDRTGDREFLYLHFSHWHSSRWTAEGRAPWSRLERLVNLSEERPTSFTISAEGFTAISQPVMAHADR